MIAIVSVFSVQMAKCSSEIRGKRGFYDRWGGGGGIGRDTVSQRGQSVPAEIVTMRVG